MESSIVSALILKKRLQEKIDKTNDEQFTLVVLEQLIEVIGYLREQDKANETRIALIKNLNEQYRNHVIKLIDDTNYLKIALEHLTESNYGKL
jgi:hypothetical protein